MIATFTALLFAHVLADFVLQTDWMVRNKRRPVALGAHIGVVLLTTALMVGSVRPELLVLAAAHLFFDAAKSFSGKGGVWPFLLDQAAHLASLVAVALWVPELWDQGVWTLVGAPTALPSVMALSAGLILATRAGVFAVSLVLAQLDHDGLPDGLQNGGAIIGFLERGMIFVLVFADQTEVIGFLIAAKSILQLNATKEGIAARQYIIVGTLASFGWGLIAAYATLYLTSLLPPLGISGLTP